jgi:cyclophilin family peptidyl-prolyl cis-trans isomerase
MRTERRVRLVSGVVLLAGALVVGGGFTQAQAPAKVKARPAAVKTEPVAPGTEVVLDTDKGEIVVRLLPDVAPLHSQLFVKNAKSGGYDGTTFHRIIMGGIIQGGDPLSKDKTKAPYGKGGLDLLRAEFSDRPFVRGVVAAARKPSSIDSGGVQFFVVLREQAAWKGQYTIFGEVSAGLEVADQISAMPVQGDTPVDRIVIRKATVRLPEAKETQAAGQ